MITPAADVQIVQRSSHRIVPMLSCRPPAGGAWVAMVVVEAHVSFAEAGAVPGRTLAGTVLVETTDGRELAGDDILSIYGSWVSASQRVFRTNGTFFDVQWGIYRVDSMTVDQITGSVSFTATDALTQIDGHQLQTLYQGRVLKTEMIGVKLSAFLSLPFAHIPPFWTGPVLDLGGVTDKLYGGTGAAYTGSRTEAAAALATKLGRVIICPRTGPLFRLITPGADGSQVVVKDGEFGNIIDAGFSDAVDRGDLFNAVTVTYAVEKIQPDGRMRTQQKRVVVSYGDTDEELRTTGPFGTVTREAVALDATTDADAVAKGQAAVGASFKQARDIQFTCGPLYGLEQGDQVSVEVPNALPVTGTLVAAEIPLAADEGGWSLTVRAYQTLDKTWQPKYSTPKVDKTEYAAADWQPYGQTRGGRIDLDNGGGTKQAWRGWTVTGGNTVTGGTRLQAKATGGDLRFTTNYGWYETATTHIYRVRASVKAAKGYTRARVGIDWEVGGSKWGPWVSVKTGKTVTAQVICEIPSAASQFRLMIESDNATAGELFQINSVSVSKAVT